MADRPDASPSAALARTPPDTAEVRVSFARTPQEEERITTIADMVRYALWKNRGTVLAMAERWGITEREVNRLHRVACRRLAASRGGPTARREHSVAVCSKIRDDELAYAERLDGEADAYLRLEEPNLKAARVAKTLAATARNVALMAQRQIDIWDQKTAGVTVNVLAPPSEHPDFSETYDRIGRMLDAWAPGLREKVLEGLEVLEEKGDRGLEEFIAEVQGDLKAIVVEGSEA